MFRSLAPVGGFLLVLLLIATLPLIGHLIVGPVSRAAGKLRAPTRFQLSDFLWLILQLQGCLAVTVQAIGIQVQSLFIPILTFLLFATTALWVGATSYLSRAGISDPWRRACFTLLVMPGTLALMIGIPLLVTVGSMSSFAYLYRVAEGRRIDLFYLATQLVGGTAVFIGTLAISWMMRRLALWVASGSDDAAQADAS